MPEAIPVPQLAALRGLGTGISAALAINTGIAGSVLLNSSGTVTDANLANAVKPAVALVAASNLTLSGEQTIDGVTTSGSLVLATAQSTGSQNGPWTTASGAWSRPTWYSSGSTTQAPQFLTTFVRLGTSYQGSTWRMTTAAVTIDTTATTWVQTPFVLGPTSVGGTLPAAQMPALTGDVTTSAGSVATTIANLSVTNAKIANATIDLTAKVTGALPQVNIAALTGDVTKPSASGVTTLANIPAISAANILANPSGTVGLSATNGTATTGMRSDGIPALSQSITPTWSGAHVFSAAAPQITLGVNTTTLGSIKLFGNTSGDATVRPAAVAGTSTVVTLPNASSTLPIFGQQITFTGPTAPRSIAMPDAAFTVARTDSNNTFTGTQTFSNGVTLSSGCTIASGQSLFWSGNKSTITCSTDGKIVVEDFAGTHGVIFDVTTDATLKVRTRTDGADASINVLNATATGTLAVTGATTLTGNLTSNGALITVPEALAPALNAGAAVGVTTLTTTIAVNGVNAVTLANGTNGQIKTVACTAVTAAGTATVTPTAANGFTTFAFTAAGQSVIIQYFTTGGWIVLSVRNATVA